MLAVSSTVFDGRNKMLSSSCFSPLSKFFFRLPNNTCTETPPHSTLPTSPLTGFHLIFMPPLAQHHFCLRSLRAGPLPARIHSPGRLAANPAILRTTGRAFAVCVRASSAGVAERSYMERSVYKLVT